jgi:Ubiquitin family.
MRNSLFLRGGNEDSDLDDDYDIDDDVTDSEKDESEYDESESEQSEDEDESNIAQEEEDNEDDEEEDDVKEDDEEETPLSNLPVKITLKTSLSDNILIDQSIEITASPSRTVHSLKQSVSRQFKGRPPIDAIVLRLDGQVLEDDILVKDLVQDIEEEDEEEEDEDEDDLAKMTITVDMVPPVDPKFGTEFKERLDKMTNQEVLDAYVANLASLHQNSLDLLTTIDESVAKEGDGDEQDEDEQQQHSASKTPITPKKLAMQQYALMLKEQLATSMSENEKTLLEKEDTPLKSSEEDEFDSYEGDLLLKESIKRKKRKGGATANVKRALQKNLNIVSTKSPN